jgi:hypothetical protein
MGRIFENFPKQRKKDTRRCPLKVDQDSAFFSAVFKERMKVTDSPAVTAMAMRSEIGAA